MDCTKGLHPYRVRGKAEAGLHSLLAAAALTLMCAIALRAGAWLLSRTVPGTTQLLLCGGMMALCLPLAYFLVYRPSRMETALRVDGEMNLGERVATMVRFSQSAGVMYEVQRQDAIRHLNALSPRQSRFRRPYRKMLLCALLLLVLAGTRLLPARVPLITQTEREITPEMILMQQMVQETAERIDSAAISEAEKEALRQQLEEMMAQLTDGSLIDLATLAEASMYTEQLLENVREAELAQSLIVQLQGTTLLREVGLALQSMEETWIRAALRSLQGQFLSVYERERQLLLERAAEEIEAVLAGISGAMEATLSSDYLSYCFVRFAKDLRTTAQAVDRGLDGAEESEENIRDMADRLALLVLAGEERAMQREAGAAGKQEAGGPMAGEANGTGQGLRLSNQLYNVGSQGVSIGGESEHERFADGEEVYEPTLDTTLDSTYVPGKKNRDGTPARQRAPEGQKDEGVVPYQRVYGLYYARLLTLLEQMDADTRTNVEMYFYTLVQGRETATEDQ